MQTDLNISLSDNNTRISIYVSSSQELSKESEREVKQLMVISAADLAEELLEASSGSTQKEPFLMNGLKNNSYYTVYAPFKAKTYEDLLKQYTASIIT